MREGWGVDAVVIHQQKFASWGLAERGSVKPVEVDAVFVFRPGQSRMLIRLVDVSSNASHTGCVLSAIMFFGNHVTTVTDDSIARISLLTFRNGKNRANEVFILSRTV